MRLSSISFTRGSTAMFGVAVVGYAALRLAGYDLPHHSGHLATPGPSMVHHLPDSRSTQQNASGEDHVTRAAAPGEDPHTQLAQETSPGVSHPADPVVVVLTSSHAPRERRQDSTTEGETSTKAPHDAPRDTTRASSDDPGVNSSTVPADDTSDAISADPGHDSPRETPADSHDEAAPTRTHLTTDRRS